MEDKQLQREIARLKKTVDSLRSSRKSVEDTLKGGDQSSLDALMRFFVTEQIKTNKALEKVTEEIKRLSEQIEMAPEVPAEEELPSPSQVSASNREVALSELDTKILNFVQGRPSSIACADDVRVFLGYKGRNAACARLTRLSDKGLLHPVRMGHRVYYKYDAGKTTNTLIISPPQ